MIQSIIGKSSEELVVLTMPDYREGNPYQELLSQALSQQNIQIVFAQGYRRIFPIYRQIKTTPNCQILHLHWLDQYLKGNSLILKIVYGLKFFLDIYLVKASNIKIVWTIHNLTSHNTKFPRFEKWVKRRFILMVDAVIVHSKAAKDEVERELLTQEHPSLEIIPHGHYRDVYPKAIAKSLAREKLGLPHDKTIFLNFGILKPYKGVDTLLEIWNQHQIDLEETYLLIAGKALDEKYGEKLSEKSKQIDNVDLRNQFVADELVHLYFSAADIVILPFQKILTSGSLLLAISYSKPVIAPRTPGIEEILGTSEQLLYNTENSTSLLSKINATLTEDISLLNKHQEERYSHLDWKQIASKTKNIYTQ